MQNGFSKKRHPDSLPPSNLHPPKRRLLDTLADLSIRNKLDTTPQQFTRRSRSPFESPYFDQNLYTSTLAQQHNDDPNRIVITNIDQFLREYPDTFDSTELVKDVTHFNVDDLVIPNIGILTQSSSYSGSNSGLKDLFDVIAKKKMNNNNNFESDNVFELCKLYFQQYTERFWSVVKYYNPQRMVFDVYVKWMNRFNKRAVTATAITAVQQLPPPPAVDLEGDLNMDLDSDIETGFPGSSDHNNTRSYDNVFYDSEEAKAKLSSHGWDRTTSGYGSYYEPCKSPEVFQSTQATADDDMAID